MCDCIFCKIIKGDIPSYKIYEDEYVYSFLDIACDAEGHILVIPKKHCVNVLDCVDSLTWSKILSYLDFSCCITTSENIWINLL